MDHKAAIKLLKQIREVSSKYYIDKLPWDSLTKIPNGYSNNIIWNIGHMISVSYSLNFTIAGLPLPTELEMVKKFRKGTFPAEYGEIDIKWIKDNILKSVELIDEAWDKDLIKEIVNPIQTDLGNIVESPSDALAMTLVHDMLHFERIRLFKVLTKPN